MTLEELLRQTRDRCEQLSGGAMLIHAAKDMDVRRRYYELDDYAVSSASFAGLWLLPKALPAPAPSVCPGGRWK
jgi:hypothetical protein